MRCSDFRLEADQRPAGAAGLSPWLGEHLESCVPCRHWEQERVRWGDMGALLREPEDAAGSFDQLALRARVRAAIPAANPGWMGWLRPAMGTLAASTVLVALTAGGIRLARLPGVETPSDNGVASRAPVERAPSSGAPALPQVIPAPQAGRVTAHAAAPAEGRTSTAGDHPVRLAQTSRTREMHARTVEGAASPAPKIVRSGNDFGIEWASNHVEHRIVRSSNPADFSSGETMVVKGPRWVDSSPLAEGVQFYLID